MTYARQGLAKHKKLMMNCDRLVESKQALVDEELRREEAEQKVEQFESKMKADEVPDEVIRKFEVEMPELPKAAGDVGRKCVACSNGVPDVVKEDLTNWPREPRLWNHAFLR